MNMRYVLLSSIGVALITGAGVFAYQVNKPIETVIQSSLVTEVKEEATVAPEPIVQEQVVEEVPVDNTVQPAQPVETPPPVQSIQELAAQYLDLSNEALQGCFDGIVAKHPDRFTEGVREHNIKALRAFYSTCSVWTRPNMTGNTSFDTYLGDNAEFFDGPLAEQFQD